MSNLLVQLADPDEVAAIVDDVRREARYVVTDFSVELVVSKFREEAEAEGEIYVPEYQRSLSWNEEQSSYFIESLILRVPVPPIFLYDVEGRLEIVDGSQRIRSLVRYLQDGFALSGLEKLDVLNGYRFSDLPPSVQRRLNNTPIRSFVLDQGTDESTRVELFRRLNTSGKRLEDAEIRKGVYRGPFLDLVIEEAASDLFKSLTPYMAKGVDARSERQELVTRFFIYCDRYLSFRHDVRKFLDSNMDELNKSADEARLLQMKAEFERTMQFIRKYYPKALYRPDGGKRVPRVRFEAIAVGTALALRDNPALKAPSDTWLRSGQFEELVRTDASNSAPKLRGRIEYVRDSLLGRSNVR
ncbi:MULTISPECIES: DUF262 domain-containing protein [unclassified Mesorhizobium]|uniref:GmrSD restriction endonuclease domain-containing protein n=1 Tax=unclassified Mesorhizobium TaxID=325217 RepID=UPI000FE9A919|nr:MULTISPECIES: DUF262 domain-containing protein [unclassified Mesorhizobium]RWH25246.1 MAG: DUF262 domain-containing protein [Mesorhizobium sp.]RWH35572.1 MAG: DUF262 domain-containing protein [Mesorhizobium sp.]TGS85770.1 DUF262 domain-containing protein [Mesorhizobium sp. M3A.F.Ca.ET.175.01.1.1]TGT23920.1 DUF262 domain-containing protein [Mesorhizobium sp. M3A.F.Ca.ET.174.01.1.1]TIR57947.1 MAG: DUF262 domain-containing protein [Mesorhizobium sp.]